jgi:hypothetical protein
MANSLEDKIKNDYSKKNLIVADTDSFYKAGAIEYGDYTSEQNYNEKIEISNTRISFVEDDLIGQGIDLYAGYHSPVDPFRQSIGRFWGLTNPNDWYIPNFYDANAGLPTDTKLYIPASYSDAPVPQYESGINTIIDLEDVTDLWQEIFPKGSYYDSLNIPRKATRLKIKFNKVGLGTGDLLQNRLSMLSLLSDIQRKNMMKAYIDQSKLGAPVLAVPNPGTAVDPADAIAVNKQLISDIQTEINKYFRVFCAIQNGINWDLGKPDVDLHNYWWQNNTYSGFFPYKNTDPSNTNPQGQIWYTDHFVPWDDKIFNPISEVLVGDYANLESGLKDLSDKLYLKHIDGNEDNMSMYVYFEPPDSTYPMGEQSKDWDITYLRYISNIWEENKLLAKGDGSSALDDPCQVDAINGIDLQYMDMSVLSRLEWIQFVTEKLSQYEDDPAVSALDKGPGLNRFTLPKFANWCVEQVQWNYTNIAYLEDTNENLQENFDNYGTAMEEYVTAKAVYDQAIEEWLATTLLGSVNFVPSDGNYNYKALLTKEGIDTSNYKQALGFNSSEMTLEELEVLYQTIEPISLGFLNEAIKDSRMDMFYNFEKEDYNYSSNVTNNHNRYYTDSVFTMNLPMTDGAILRVNDSDNGGFAINIKSEYNYYSPYYELLTKQESYKNKEGYTKYLHETYLPNIYDTPIDQDGTVSESIESAHWTNDESKFKFEELGYNMLNCVNADSPWNPKKANIVVDQRYPKYIEKYEAFKSAFPFHVNIDLSYKYPGDPANLKLSGIGDRFVNFAKLFNDTGMTLLLMQSWISNFFPRSWFSFQDTYAYQNAQTFDPVDKSKIIRAVGDSSISSAVLETQKYYDPIDSSSEYNKLSTESDNPSAVLCDRNIYRVKEKNTVSELVESQVAGESYLKKNLLKYQGWKDGQEKMHREFDLNKWLDYFFNTKDVPTSQKLDADLGISDAIKSTSIISSKLDLGGEAAVGSFGPVESSSDNAASQNGTKFLGQYVELVDQLQMDYAGICGKPGSNGLPTTYNETLFYRILKTAVDDDGNPIAGHAQNIWIIQPNEPEGDGNFNIMKYIDTQVKYGQAYEYQVFAYQIVVGSKYNFQFVNSINPVLPEEKPTDEPEEDEDPIIPDPIDDPGDQGEPDSTDPSDEEATEIAEELVFETGQIGGEYTTQVVGVQTQSGRGAVDNLATNRTNTVAGGSQGLDVKNMEVNT